MTSRNLDQFYTKKSVAKKYFNILLNFVKKENIVFSDWLEPSAGTGVFYNLMPTNKLGIDLDPKIDGVIQHDFLNFNLEHNHYITVGNPPFGKNSSLALKFFNKSAKHSILVAFILPKTFKKSSLVKRMDKKMHLIYEEEVPKKSFEFNGKDYDVPCVFQIWLKKEEERIDIEFDLNHPDIVFTTKEKANIAFQRIGSNAGKIKTFFDDVAATSHYFIKASQIVRENLYEIDWSKVKHNTAGNPSISKRELIHQYKLKLLITQTSTSKSLKNRVEEKVHP